MGIRFVTEETANEAQALINARDFTYIQAFIDVEGERWGTSRYLVALHYSRPIVDAVASEAVLSSCPEGSSIRGLHLYPRTYIRESREILMKDLTRVFFID